MTESPKPLHWLDEGESRAWRGYVRMHQLLDSQLERELNREVGLSLADYTVLVHLSEADGRRLRMSALAQRVQWSRSRLSHQVGRMQQRGLVERIECPTDARGSFAVLTGTGLRTIERAAPTHLAGVRRHLLERLSPAQIAALAAISDAVIEPLEGTPPP